MKSKTPFIIAEIGVNHNGSLLNAKKLIDYASKKKVNAVKFQFFKAENLVIKNLDLAPYQKTKKNKTSQFKMLKKYEFDIDQHILLSKYCKKKNIEYMTSFFDTELIKYHRKLNLKRLKIPSGEMTNVPYLEAIAKINKQILLSTGMSNYKEVLFAIKTILKVNEYHKKRIVLMQCTSEYPTLSKNVNLNVLKTYKNLGYKIGFSDHTKGYQATNLAIALGAEYIEKHITLDNKLLGPDHKASLSIKNFNIYLKKINETINILGSYVKRPSKVEKINSVFVKKKIITTKRINKGELFSKNNLTTIRSKKGINSILWNKYIGKKAKKNYEKFQIV